MEQHEQREQGRAVTVEVVDRRGTDCLKWDFLEKIYGDKDLMSMWVADMDFRCPDCVNDALRGYVDQGVYGYSSLAGRFTDAFVAWERERHGFEVDPAWVKYAPGVVAALHWCILSMTEPGDAVLVLPPVYHPFFDSVEGCGRTLVESNLVFDGRRWRMDLADIERAIVEHNVKMLAFCSPHNPVSRVWERDELDGLLAVCNRHGIVVVSDEIHQDFAFGGARQIPLGSLQTERVVMLSSPSKTFNLAGLCNAMAVIPDGELRERWDAFVKRLGVNHGDSLAYIAGTAAYRDGAPWLDAVLDLVEENYRTMRAILLEGLPKLRVVPLEGTYLMWVDFGAYLPVEAEVYRTFFEKECRIAVDYGAMFRGPGSPWVRFNLATDPAMVRRAAEAIVHAMGTRLAAGGPNRAEGRA